MIPKEVWKGPWGCCWLPVVQRCGRRASVLPPLAVELLGVMPHLTFLLFAQDDEAAVTLAQTSMKGTGSQDNKSLRLHQPALCAYGPCAF